MSFIVGFEGAPSTEFDITYGAAAIRDNDTLLNAVTKSSSNFSLFDKYVKSGALYCIPEPIPFEYFDYNDDLWVIAINEKYQYHKLLIDYFNEPDSIYKTLYKNSSFRSSSVYMHGVTYIIISKLQKIDFSSYVCKRILQKIFSAQSFDEESLDLVKCGLLLDPHQPYLNAIRYYKVYGSLARYCIRGDKAEKEFNKLYYLLFSKYNIVHNYNNEKLFKEILEQFVDFEGVF